MENGDYGVLVNEFLWTCQINYGSANEYLHDGEEDILSNDCEDALGIKGDNHWWIGGYCEIKGGDGLPKGIFANDRRTKGNLDLSQSGTIGEYCKISGIPVDILKFGTGRIVQRHRLLDWIEIMVENFVIIMSGQE